MPTANKLLAQMRKLSIPLPSVGSGRDGKILNSDLEQALAEYHAAQIPNQSWGWRARQVLREVMLSYRWDKLKEPVQQYVLEDNNEWVAEEKYDGCRMIVTYDPLVGFGFYGRNRSRVTHLPIDYTSKVLIDGKAPWEFAGAYLERWMLDAEIISDGYVETKDGWFTGTQLNAATAVLQLNDVESHLAQRTTAPLQCMLFDAVPMLPTLQLDTSAAAQFCNRREKLIDIYYKLIELCGDGFFRLGRMVENGKKALLDSLLAQGREGIILKNKQGLYVPGINNYRARDVNLKIKRTMTGALGDEIDAYVIGYTNGPEWDKRGLIAGLKLAVKLRKADGSTEEHWIATVSSIPDDIRVLLSTHFEPTEEIYCNNTLAEEFYGQVLTIDGQDISARNRRIAHARADWSRGFRADKTADMCILDEDFLDSQMF